MWLLRVLLSKIIKELGIPIFKYADGTYDPLMFRAKEDSNLRLMHPESNGRFPLNHSVLPKTGSARAPSFPGLPRLIQTNSICPARPRNYPIEPPAG
jgi:hypothetical protein